MKKNDHNRFGFMLVVPLIILFTTFTSILAYDKQQPVKGAKTAEELSDVLFQAFYRNQASILGNVVPGEEELEYLKKTSSERNKPFFEGLETSNIQSRVTAGFENVTRKGIEKNINWSGVELVDYETRSCSIELIGCNVTFTILDQKNNRLVVTYDAIKVKDRWFLFQNLGLVNEEKGTEVDIRG